VQIENVPQEVLIGEEFTFTVVFDNVGTDPGYGPFIDLVFPTGGADLDAIDPTTSLPGPCDGITFVSAKLGATIPPSTACSECLPAGSPLTSHIIINPPQPPLPADVVPNCVGSVNTGPLLHPYSQVSPATVTINPGDELVTIGLPFSNYGNTALDSPPSIVVEVTVRVHEYADVGVPLWFRARAGFRYGATPNGPSAILGPWFYALATPAAFTLQKDYSGPEDETVPGPNFVKTYSITVDVAEDQTVAKLQVVDDLTTGVEYADNLNVSSCTTPVLLYQEAFPNTYCGQATPGLPLEASVCEPACSGGLLDVMLCDPVTGMLGCSDELLTAFDFFVPDQVLDPVCQSSPAILENDVKATGWFIPLDPRDAQGIVTSDLTPVDYALQAKCVAIQKSVEIDVDTGEPGMTPGDLLKYTLQFQISDYRTVGKLLILDSLSDGQQYLPLPAPVLTLGDQFGGYSTGFSSATLAVAPDPFTNCGLINGVTELQFDVSGALIAAAQASGTPPDRHLQGILTGGLAAGSTLMSPAIGTLVYYARIKDEFANPQPGDTFVDKDDPVTNCVRIQGVVLENAHTGDVPDISQPTGSVQDDSCTQCIIVTGFLEKSVFAVYRNGTEICGPVSGNSCFAPDVLPGDEVTFRVEYTIPSGDAESLTITDWPPLPVFDVSDPDAKPSTPSPSTWPLSTTWPWVWTNPTPQPGSASFGPSHTQPIAPQPICFAVPPPTANPVFPPDNYLAIDYGTSYDPFNYPKSIDLLFTLTVTHEPFSDGLILTNEALECEDNTFGQHFCQAAVAQVNVREPVLSIRKGVVATDNPYGQFGTYDPATGAFNPGAAPVPTANTPHSNCPHVVLSTANPVNHNSVASFISSDLHNVDACDWVTFAIAVENTGGAPAYEIELDDFTPLNAVDAYCCFVPDYDGLDGLCVTDGSGTNLPFTTQSMPHGRLIIELQNPLPPLDSSSSATGTNIAIITFDAQLLDGAQMQSGCCANRAKLVRYTSAADTHDDTWPNYVGAGFGGPFEDTAWGCVGPRAYGKCIQETSETHTLPPSGSAVDAAIGEIVRFRLIAVIPEGTALDFQIEDHLPLGLTYIGNPTVAFVTTSGNVTSGSNFWPTIYPGNEATHGACPGPAIPQGNALDVATTPFVFGTGQHPVFFVQSQTNPAPKFAIHNPDCDSDLELAIIEFNAQVDNIASNQNGVTLTNRFEVRCGSACWGNPAPSLSSPAYVHIVEPELTLTKTVNLTSVQPGDTVTYTVTITNNSTVDAFDVSFNDPLPTDLAPVSGSVSCSGCLGCSCGILWQNIIGTCPLLSKGGGTMTMTYQATVSATVQCNPPTTLTNTATVTWTSLPGPGGTPPGPLNLTGQSTVGVSGDPDGERDGSDGLPGSGVLNDYQVQDSATVTVECCPCVHPLPPKMAAWWPLDETSGSTAHDIFGGFDGTTWPGQIGAVSGGGPASSAFWLTGFMFPVGVVDNSLFFDLGQYVKVPHATALDPGTGDFTVDAWVSYAESWHGPRNFTIVKKGSSSVPGTAWWHFFIRDRSPAYPTGELVFEVGSTSGSAVTPAVTITPTPMGGGWGWHHVAATFKRGTPDTIVLYVDGVGATFPFVAGAIDSNVASTGDLYIAGGSQIQAIAIDEVEIFHYALAQSEVQGIFNADSAGKCKPDLGDAPDSTNHAGTPMLAYAYPAVSAHFPTVYDPNLPGNAPLGPIHWLAKDLAWLGKDVSFEGEADTGWDQDGSTNIQPSLGINDNDGFDDGVAGVSLPNCAMTSFTFTATNAGSTVPVYINVWFDWNHDGDWDDVSWCSLAGTMIPAPEWAVPNYQVTLGPGFNYYPSNPAMMTPTFVSISPPLGQTIWMRITLTDVPVSATNSDGSGPVGGYCYGETEDYLWQAKGPATPCVQAPPDMVSWWPADGTANDIVDANPGTLLGSAGYAPGMVGQAFSFVAAGDGARVPTAADLNFGPAGSVGADLSIDAWIATSSTARVLPIVDKRALPGGASGSQSTGYILFLYGGRLAFQLGDGTFFNYISPSSLPDLRTGAWHHVAVTVDRTSPTGGNLYVDGVVVLNFNPTNRPGSLTNNEPLFIGRHAGDPNTTFIGLIDEVEIFDRELTAGEVLSIFTAGANGKCK
jgi:uncharacterized repeat protein (TIGR01451 family)